jgi:hypothetical protein
VDAIIPPADEDGVIAGGSGSIFTSAAVWNQLSWQDTRDGG